MKCYNMNINRNNYEEYFLLYIDRELNADEQEALESFVRRHPDLEKELDRLKQTVNFPPEIIFDNKDSLLREEKKRRFLPVYWMRIAASLIILLAGAWVMLIIIPSKNTPQGQTADRNIKPARDKNQIKKPSPGMITDEVKNAVRGKDSDPAVRSDHAIKADHVVKSDRAVKSDHAIKAAPGMNADQVRNPATDQVKNQVPDLKKNQVPFAKANPHPTNQGASQIPNAETNEKNQQSIAVVSQLPDLAQETALPSTINYQPSTIPSTINHQPSTIPSTVLPSTINHQPSTIQPSTNSPDESTSILVFDNKSKAVTGFLRKLLPRSPGDDVVSGSHQKKISVSIFQFSMSKQ